MVTRLIRDVRDQIFGDKLVVATLGNFDGVHLGHQRLIERVLSWKEKLGETSGGRQVKSVVISFFPPPATFINKSVLLSQITSVREKYLIFDQYQIDYMCLLRFNAQLAGSSAERFVSDVLLKQLNIAVLVIGDDAGVGQRREGDSGFIAKKFRAAGREAEIVPLLDVNGEKISSRRIRSCLEMGDIKQVNQFLGRPFTLSGRVVMDQRRGAGLGFPTANLYLPGQMLPRFGVYVTTVLLGDRKYPSVTNVGIRPTFSAVVPVVETHILDFKSEQFYGERITVEFHKYIREELKFSNKQGLILQIEQDIQRARQTFAKMCPSNSQ